jgi:predicted phage terminase large subunit-like protein
MTRWNIDDLAGRLLKLQAEDPAADQWEVVNLEAVATESGRATTLEEDTRQPGEVLWPGRYDRAFMDASRSTLGSAAFEAMYQGRPVAEGGNQFKEHWLTPLPAWELVRLGEHDHYRVSRRDGSVELYAVHQCPRFSIIDPAASEKQAADFTAIGTFATTPKNELLVVGMVRERLGVERIVPRALQVCREHGCSWVGVESSGFQVSIVNNARRTPGMPAVRELQHKGKGKLVRATPAIIRAESGQLILPKEAPWKKPLIDELVSFTGDGDRHDDQVDTVAYAAISMGGGSIGAAVSVE